MSVQKYGNVIKLSEALGREYPAFCRKSPHRAEVRVRWNGVRFLLEELEAWKSEHGLNNICWSGNAKQLGHEYVLARAEKVRKLSADLNIPLRMDQWGDLMVGLEVCNEAS